MERKPIILIEDVTRVNKFNFVVVYIGQFISEWPKHLPKVMKGHELSWEIQEMQNIFQSSFNDPN